MSHEEVQTHTHNMFWWLWKTQRSKAQKI